MVRLSMFLLFPGGSCGLRNSLAQSLLLVAVRGASWPLHRSHLNSARAQDIYESITKHIDGLVPDFKYTDMFLLDPKGLNI